ncbi:MAG TPA: hypothetical protein VFF06_20850 [Polyangia bacterium]|nr:hypothetical protein [Polyangia bacterium]
MATSQIFGVIIGLAFTYLLLSLICTAMNEVAAWFFELRSKTLRQGIATLLGEPGPKNLWGRFGHWIMMKTPTGPMVTWLYDHALVKTLAQGQMLPSYIPSRTFATAVLDLLKEKAATVANQAVAGAAPQGPLAEAHVVLEMKNAIELLPNADLKKSLKSLLDESVVDLDGARAKLATWYDDAMDRVSGWYKRRAQFQTWICAALVAFACNADTITIGKALWKDPALRDEVSQAATNYINTHQPPQAPAPAPAPAPAEGAPTGAAPTGAPPTGAAPTQPQFPVQSWKTASASYAELQADKLPIGWHFAPPYLRDLGHWGWRVVFYKLIGLLLTMLALSQGAPFWFDALSKAVRSSGPRPEKHDDGADGDA